MNSHLLKFTYSKSICIKQLTVNTICHRTHIGTRASLIESIGRAVSWANSCRNDHVQFVKTLSAGCLKAGTVSTINQREMGPLIGIWWSVGNILKVGRTNAHRKNYRADFTAKNSNKLKGDRWRFHEPLCDWSSFVNEARVFIIPNMKRCFINLLWN